MERPQRRERRGGKSDRIDALLAKKVLTREGLSTPRGSGKRLALQMLLAGYRSIVSERSRLYNQLQALQISAPYALRERIGQTRNGATLANRLTGMRTRPTATQQENLTLQVLRDIANRARALDAEAENYTRQIEEMARSLAPRLLEEPGVGPICAGRLLAFNPSRFTSEAAFARANGTAPQPASSGKTVRHRLSRGGDRQINTAIYTIALSRSVHHAPSRAYIQRRINEGKTKREAIRSLKRYLSRDLYQHFTKTPLTTWKHPTGSQRLNPSVQAHAAVSILLGLDTLPLLELVVGRTLQLVTLVKRGV